MHRTIDRVFGALLLAMTATAARAQDFAAQPLPASDPGFSFSVTPYAWLISVKGTAAAGADDMSTAYDVDASLRDILPNAEGAFLLKSELSAGRFGLLGDATYGSFSVDGKFKIIGSKTGQAELDVEFLESTVAGRYRVVDDERAQVDLLAGARISYIKLKANLTAFDTVIKDEASNTWVDGVVGARIRWPLSQAWGLTAYADAGAGESKFTGQILTTFDYGRPDSNWKFFGGYRYYSIDYENRPTKLDLDLHGPILGATYRF